MDDQFFQTACDLDKALDELEQQETSKIAKNSSASAVPPHQQLFPQIKKHQVYVDRSYHKLVDKDIGIKNHGIDESRSSLTMEEPDQCDNTEQLVKLDNEEYSTHCAETNTLVDLSLSNCDTPTISFEQDQAVNRNENDGSLPRAGMMQYVDKNHQGVADVLTDQDSGESLLKNEVSEDDIGTFKGSSQSAISENIKTADLNGDVHEAQPVSFSEDFHIDSAEFESFMNEGTPFAYHVADQPSTSYAPSPNQPKSFSSQQNVAHENQDISSLIKEYFPESDESGIDEVPTISAASFPETNHVQPAQTSSTVSPTEELSALKDTEEGDLADATSSTPTFDDKTLAASVVEDSSDNARISSQLAEAASSSSDMMESEAAEPSTSTARVVDTVVRPGSQKPVWIPDAEKTSCSNCQDRFTFTRRRHHCRACGKIFCNACCNFKCRLEYLNFEEARVCINCKHAIEQADLQTVASLVNDSFGPSTSHHPSDPTQPQSILHTSSDVAGTSSGGKNVRFSDGTKPDHPQVPPSTPPLPNKLTKSRPPPHSKATNLPPIVKDVKDGVMSVYDCERVSDVAHLIRDSYLVFALSPNLYVSVRLITYHEKSCLYFLSSGLANVGQAEVAVLFEIEEDTLDGNPMLGEANLVQIFKLYAHLFNTSRKGKFYQPMHFVPHSSFVVPGSTLFGNDEHAGLLLVKTASHDLTPLTYHHTSMFGLMSSPTALPESVLFGVIVRKCEMSWVSLFPTRLLLGLGAHLEECPYPLRNRLSRATLYPALGNTIMSILCDFRNYKYRLITVPGLIVRLVKDRVVVDIPENRMGEVVKVMKMCNEHVLVFGSSAPYSSTTASHNCLAYVQNNLTTTNYSTKVIRRSPPCAAEAAADAENENSTSAAFVVFNGSLKSRGKYNIKSSVVEDGVMVEMSPEKIDELKACIHNRESFAISNVGVKTNSDTDVVGDESELMKQSFELKWNCQVEEFNVGLRSCVDCRSLQGVIGYNVNKSEKKTKSYVLRWNQVYCFGNQIPGNELGRFAEMIGGTASHALLPHLQQMRQLNHNKFAIRANIHPEDVGYSAGSGGEPLSTACLDSLDNYLIPLLHDSSSNLPHDHDPIEFEMVFSILEISPSWVYHHHLNHDTTTAAPTTDDQVAEESKADRNK